ncbi:MAG: hypothetical protein HC828_09900 [Blastochloris sp.]|nr:hypothetical protein [Blastochloris sp.]
MRLKHSRHLAATLLVVGALFAGCGPQEGPTGTPQPPTTGETTQPALDAATGYPEPVFDQSAYPAPAATTAYPEPTAQ